jgi:spoIIIJ-associated protein
MANEERVIETAGKDVESAINTGLAQLGVERNDVEIEVLDEGRQGMFGIGARAARVRLKTTVPKETQPEPPSTRPEPAPQAEPTRPKEPTREKAPSEPTPVEPPEVTPTPTPPSPTPPPPKEKPVEPTKQPEPPVSDAEELEVVHGVTEDLLAIMGMGNAQIEVERAEPGPNDSKVPPWEIDVRGPGTDALIGHHGDTLDALQRIIRLIVGREMRSWVHLVVDVQGYKAQRAEELRSLAYRMANQAVDSDRTVVLEPMPPHERREIHVALYDDSRVTTESIGEGDRRRVTITPQR